MARKLLKTALWPVVTVLVISLATRERIVAQSPVEVCATIPDLADLAREVGGDQVAVTAFTKGVQDPHFLEARPSFIKSLNQADLYVQVGLELEIGWAPRLLGSARNPRVIFGSSGFVDGATAISPLEVPVGQVDRSMGDVHALGNPHYLLDPLSGLKVARLIRDRLAALRPAKTSYFEDRYSGFTRRLATRLLGEELVKQYRDDEISKLLLLLERGGLARFTSFLDGQAQKALLGGWLGLALPHAGTKVAADHNLWPYFAERFGLKVIGFLEPKPGITPTTRHLTELIERMKEEKVRAIFMAPYFSARYADLVTRSTGAAIVPMAHQVEARPGCDSYLDMIDYNVRQVVAALESRE